MHEGKTPKNKSGKVPALVAYLVVRAVPSRDWRSQLWNGGYVLECVHEGLGVARVASPEGTVTGSH